MKKRKYTLRRRAEQQEQTRARIVEATVALHEEVGPARTTIKAVAEKAGVERLTVYRHFPDEHALFTACSSRFLELNPPPDPEDWSGLEDPAARTTKALTAMYRFYRATEKMWSRVYRDREDVEALGQVTSDFERYLDGIRDDLLSCWQPSGRGRREVGALIRHALEFRTWESFSRKRLSDTATARLFVRWIDKTPPGARSET